MFKTVLKGVDISLLGIDYHCDLAVGLYPETMRPAILLLTSPVFIEEHDPIQYSEIIAKASVCVPEEYIQHLPEYCFAAKVWSENEGLWEQLLSLRDENNMWLFEDLGQACMMGFVKAPFYELSSPLYDAFLEVKAEYLSNKESKYEKT